MSSEAIYKLQPHRTMHLQGFDGYGCTACLHDAGAAGFSLTGIWGEQSDFAVLVLFDADNQFEHPRMRYLPDWAFDGVVLAFRLAMTGCVPLDSDYYRWIDWGMLNVLYADRTTQGVALIDCATAAVGTYTAATVQFTLGGTMTPGDYVELAWLDEHYNHLVAGGETAGDVISALAAWITAHSGTVSASSSGNQITLTWLVGSSLVGKGANANGRIGVYGSVSGSRTESWAPVSDKFSGGTSPTAWDVSIDFSAKLTQPTAVQRMWITFAPPISAGAAFAGGAWSAAVTDWAVTDSSGRRALKVAGPGSVRIEEDSAWVVRTGYWESADAVGWWSQGRAIRAAASGAAVTIETHCQATHDIYVGTRLDADCGIVQAALDGGTPVTLDCYGVAANVRRKLFSGVAAGQHSVVITLTGTKNVSSSGWYFYLDFLECAVPGDVPDAPEVRTDFGLACDFDTDNTYKLAPARLVWGIQRTGLVGEIDHYLGVFWWPCRKMRTLASVWAQVSTITFSGTPGFGDHIYLSIGATVIDHLCLIGDTAATVALAFALVVNQGSTTFWAEADAGTLTLHGLAGSAGYHLAVSVSPGGPADTTNGSAVAVEWGVDESAPAPVNAAVAAWHADFFAVLVAAGIGVVAAFSDELVNPPDAVGAVWVQRFADGTKVETATGFGTLKSAQVAFSAGPAAYMAAAYAQMAALMVAAGLTPRLQFGEVLWWFQAGGAPASMAFYDADTAAAAVVALGRALATFSGPSADPAVNAYADADFLRARLKAYVDGVRAAVVAAVATAVFDLLWPMDVDDPDTARLCRYVNLPAEWMARAGSGWDTFTVEGFQYGGTDHDADKARRCAAYPFAELSWDPTHCRYLMGWFYSGWPWVREYRAARAALTPVVKAWALDHLCLMGWSLPLPAANEVAVLLS